MRREWKARPAITKLSGMGDLIRILDLQRLADKLRADPGGGDGLLTNAMVSSPSKIADEFSQPAERSMDARPQKPAQVHADSERVAVELQRNAAAVVEFEIEVTDRFVIDTRVVAVVAD